MSQAESSKAGQHPRADRPTQATARIINRFVKGMASRFVSRKYFGNVPKRSQASGPVNTWQEMDSAINSHSRRGRFQRSLPGPSDGYQADRRGKSSTMPAIARYDSWKPTEEATEGVKASWMVKAPQSTWTGEGRRTSKRPASFRKMNRKARTSEGEAPVAKV